MSADVSYLPLLLPLKPFRVLSAAVDRDVSWEFNPACQPGVLFEEESSVSFVQCGLRVCFLS